MPREIKNIELKRELKAIDPELDKIKLMKDDGYFYLSSDDELWGNRIGEFYFNSILINSFKHLTIREWVEEIIDVLIQNRWDVFKEMEPWQAELKMKTIEKGY